jgi:hypothetical protein
VLNARPPGSAPGLVPREKFRLLARERRGPPWVYPQCLEVTQIQKLPARQRCGAGAGRIGTVGLGQDYSHCICERCTTSMAWSDVQHYSKGPQPGPKVLVYQGHRVWHGLRRSAPDLRAEQPSSASLPRAPHPPLPKINPRRIIILSLVDLARRCSRLH